MCPYKLYVDREYIAIFGATTRSQKTLKITTLSINKTQHNNIPNVTFSLISRNRGVTTFSTRTLSIMTFTIMTLSINDTQYN